MGKLWELISWRLETVLGANYAEAYGLEPWVAREKFEEFIDQNLCEDCRRKILKAFDEWLLKWKATATPKQPVKPRIPYDVWQEIRVLSLRVESLEKRLECLEKKLNSKKS
jgi:predicted transglutaminase-like protease